MNIYVDNIPGKATKDDLKKLFEDYDTPASVTVIREEKDKSKGFAIIKMKNQEAAESAIKALDGHEFMEHHQLKVETRTEFHNPYTFIPSPPRGKIKAGEFAGDFDPLGHNLDHTSLHPKLWTGYIPIKLTTITPLVLLKDDGRERDSNEHQTYDVHDRIPESSLRGMLRSAYEVVTNSRYGSFDVGNKKYGQMLDGSLKPAQKPDQLSPADRLFGWAPQGQGSHGGYKGRIRIVCEDKDSKDPGNDKKQETLKRFEGGDLPLTILSTPKPSYVRFYVAKNAQGDPQKDGLSKGHVGYDSNKSLRGRKQYWHHKGLEVDPSKAEHEQAKEYWHPSVEDRTQIKSNNRYQEYRRPDQRRDESKNGWQQKDKHNRSIEGWIPPGTVLKASLYVQNLQFVEVGALLWLLTLNNKLKDEDEKYYFRLGYGKPLGFGSVTMEIDETRLKNCCLPLSTGKDWEEYYADFDADMSLLAKLDQNQRSCCIQKFKTSMAQAYSDGQSFDKLPFIEGFLQVLRGPKTDLPIHYPRLTCKPNSAGRNFKWFDENKDEKKGLKLSLPHVTAKEGLPYNPNKK